MPGDLIPSKRDAPILRESVTGSPPISFFRLTRTVSSVRTAFPSLQYMCHLWPARAVERWSDITTAEHKRPANPVLVLGNDLNPLSDPQYADSVLRSLRGPNDEHREDADIVLQTQFGVCYPIPSVCSVYADDNLHIGPRHRTRTLCERRDIRLSPQRHGQSASDESVGHPYYVSTESHLPRCLHATAATEMASTTTGVWNRHTDPCLPKFICEHDSSIPRAPRGIMINRSRLETRRATGALFYFTV